MLTFFALAVLAEPEISAVNAAGAEQPCELHLWGARKSFPENSKFAAPFAIKGTYHADKTKPLANINITDPVLRLSRLSDDNFAGYFGKNVPIVLVRHADIIDPKSSAKTKAPLSFRSASCNGDLILSNLVDVEGPVDDPGLMPGLLMAPAGMNMQITFRRFSDGGKLLFAKRDGVNGDLAIPRSQWANDEVNAVKAIDESVADGIRDFFKEHLVQR